MNKSEKKTQNERAAARRSCEPPQADGSMRFHRMHQFWELANGLPVKKVRLSELKGFDEVRWFGGPRNLLPTCRAIAEHARDIYEADLTYPIILSPTGEVLDGWARRLFGRRIANIKHQSHQQPSQDRLQLQPCAQVSVAQKTETGLSSATNSGIPSHKLP
jgi:hypothetical protein